MVVDPAHWLYRFTPREWIRASLGELDQARKAYAAHNGRAGLAGCRRAAGVALNGMLACASSPDPRYGRSYMEHLEALSTEPGCPAEVRDAALALVQTPLPGGAIVALRTATTDQRLVSAAETIMAWCYGEVVKCEPPPAGTP